jgi:flagellar protein FlbD
MILVHRLRGEPLYLNPDLIEAIEATPDTVLTLVDGRRTVVADGIDDVVDRILRFRAQVLVTADEMRANRDQEPGTATLRVLPGGDD